MRGTAKNAWADEEGMTPEERLEAVVELLTRAVLRMVELECEEMARGIVKVRTAACLRAPCLRRSVAGRDTHRQADRGAGHAGRKPLTSGRTDGLMGH